MKVLLLTLCLSLFGQSTSTTTLHIIDLKKRHKPHAENYPVPKYDQIDWKNCTTLPDSVEKPIRTRHGTVYYIDERIAVYKKQPYKAFRLPEGFVALGAAHKNGDCVSFMPHQRAVMVKESEFLYEEHPLEGVSDKVKFYFYKDTTENEKKRYIALLQDAFKRVQAVFPKVDRLGERSFTILVQHEMLGLMNTPSTRLFTAGSRGLLVVERSWFTQRNYELVLHRAAHFFNRYNNLVDTQTYTSNEEEVPRVAFEEMVASWAEIYYMPDVNQRYKRVLHYYYPSHLEFIKRNSRQKFETSHKPYKGLLNIDYNYSLYTHYLLGPLLLVGLESLYLEHNSDYNVEQLLREVHHREHKGFLAAIENTLPPKAVKEFKGWIYGDAIPLERLEAALEYYDKIHDQVGAF